MLHLRIELVIREGERERGRVGSIDAMQVVDVARVEKKSARGV